MRNRGTYNRSSPALAGPESKPYSVSVPGASLKEQRGRFSDRASFSPNLSLRPREIDIPVPRRGTYWTWVLYEYKTLVAPHSSSSSGQGCHTTPRPLLRISGSVKTPTLLSPFHLSPFTTSTLRLRPLVFVSLHSPSTPTPSSPSSSSFCLTGSPRSSPSPTPLQ